MVYTYFESQKFIHPMSLVPNRTPRALGKALAGKKMPTGTRLGTAALALQFNIFNFVHSNSSELFPSKKF
jgi:hypothetical protein